MEILCANFISTAHNCQRHERLLSCSLLTLFLDDICDPVCCKLSLKGPNSLGISEFANLLCAESKDFQNIFSLKRVQTTCTVHEVDSAWKNNFLPPEL